MQKQKKTSKPQKTVETFPAVDDFFTQFLDKKKRNYTKKIDKIETLQKKNFEELTPEQKELVNNRQRVTEKAQYYEDIKNLYFEASFKKEVVKTAKTGDVSDCIHSTLSLYYVGNCAKESGETAMRVLGNYGVDFQEKVHKYHNKAFGADYKNVEELKKAEEGLAEYLKDSEVSKVAGEIVSEGKLVPAPEAEPKEVKHKESSNKPQLFAMSSDEEEEEFHQMPKEKQTESGSKQLENVEEIKPKLVPLPEDDNEEGFAFDSVKKTGGERRGRKPRGDRPYRKYDGERRERKEHAEGEEIREVKEENLDGKPRTRGGYRGRNRDKDHDENREKGDRRKPYGRGRGKHYNKERRDDNEYQKKEAHVD